MGKGSAADPNEKAPPWADRSIWRLFLFPGADAGICRQRIEDET